MKNKLLKGAHLSEKKCREILQLFCDDLTATQIAEISGVSRVTVNNYFRLIRSVIAGFCEHSNQLRNMIYGETLAKTPDTDCAKGFYGFYITDGRIGTTWLKNFSDQFLNDLNNHSATGVAMLPGYDAVADCNDWRLYWINGKEHLAPADGANIAGFWAHTKGRLQKFRGLNKSTLYLHIKECEFRYNFRHNDILPVLSDIINNKKHIQSDVSAGYETTYKKVVL
ncbi:MAG: hypothetical protein ACTHLE_08970 [Agriterribacter sp.]